VFFSHAVSDAGPPPGHREIESQEGRTIGNAT
jgi:hypothetical protein